MYPTLPIVQSTNHMLILKAEDALDTEANSDIQGSFLQ